MAEWQHKESTWLNPIFSDRYLMAAEHWADVNGQPVYEKFDGKVPVGAPRSNDILRPDHEIWPEESKRFEEFKSRAITFTQWLDLNSKDGWEVFHISKESNHELGKVSKNGVKNIRTKIWCIFRRLV
jgi:hypothetical protein